MNEITLKYDYGIRFGKILAVIGGAFSVSLLMSILGILPEFPLVKDMGSFGRISILAICCLITVLCFNGVRKKTAIVKSIVHNGELVKGRVVGKYKAKHSITIEYEFNYSGENHKGSSFISKKYQCIGSLSSGNEVEILAMKDNNGKTKSILKNVYFQLESV
ncbi:hypothetical protein [Oceanirhabdus sp. W0125-5]|uniref:hypothetical protein n=1 Tax=Oceanirhabdus sp. W0125-5 TaxID=2999116 RepID=UPI0022F31783|nr:hypothetical protein [Oceanirhabdus sp. W0125-5]WBW95928.1 hypothetical protein OW730_19880 [Oceanirhabdus sp. W0125-5]